MEGQGKAAKGQGKGSISQRAVKGQGTSHLEGGERPEQDLALVRVLGEPTDEPAAVAEAHLHLEEQAVPAVRAPAPALDRAPVDRRGGERVLDRAQDVRIRPGRERVRQAEPGHAAKDRRDLGCAPPLKDRR